jgi:hypothetical protein
MISHRLMNVICNNLIEILAFTMICFRVFFYFFVRAFARYLFINENDIFSLKKKKSLNDIYIYIYIYIVTL